MQRLVCSVALFTLVLVHSPAAPNAHHVDAAVQEDTFPLFFDTPLSGSVPPRQDNTCSMGQTQFTIQYPGGATRIKIEVTAASSLTISARFGQRVSRENGQFFADASSFGNQLYFPGTAHSFEAGTYYIAVINCGSEQVDYTIRAKLLMPPDADTAALTPETSFGEIPAAPPGSCSLGRTQYKITTPDPGPCGGIFFRFDARSNQLINLYVRRDQRVAIEDGQIIADRATTLPGRSQAIGLPSSSGGTFYIAIGNCSTATADYVIGLLQAVPLTTPDVPLINGCDLERTPAGAFVLNVFGANFKAEATFTVGGMAPKKIRFVELEPGSTTTYRVVRLVKKICNGLPGNIVVTNPSPCSGSSSPFFCNTACPN